MESPETVTKTEPLLRVVDKLPEIEAAETVPHAEVTFKDGPPPPRVRPELLYLAILLCLAAALLTLHVLRGRVVLPQHGE